MLCVFTLYEEEEALGNKWALPDVVCHSSRTPSKENQPVFWINSVRGKGGSTLVLSIEVCFNMFDKYFQKKGALCLSDAPKDHKGFDTGNGPHH